MTPAIACSLGGGGGPVTRFETILVLLIAGTIILVAVCRGIVEEWIERTHGRYWPTVSALIGYVSVAFVEDNFAMYAMDSSYYKVTLTYVYRYPEEQTGDYSRRFGRHQKGRC